MIRWLICLTLAHLTGGSTFYAAAAAAFPWPNALPGPEVIQARLSTLMAPEMIVLPRVDPARDAAILIAQTAPLPQPSPAAPAAAAPAAPAEQEQEAAPPAEPAPRVTPESKPRSGRNSRASTSQSTSAGTSAHTNKTDARLSGPVNINTATVQELDGLPGIGAHMAQRIIDYRQKNGPFKKLEDLMGVRGIGEKNFLKLKPLITLTTPKGDRAGISER